MEIAYKDYHRYLSWNNIFHGFSMKIFIEIYIGDFDVEHL